MIKVGIDLGTTNSVATIFDRGNFEQIKFGRLESLSSVLYYESGKVRIGDSAKKRSLTNPENYISSSKTFMGDMKKSWKIEDRTFSPTDVATEILSEIKKGIKKHTGNDEVEAVITVPAYFKSSQIDETKRAGENAGFKVKQIITEPVAAAIAYGFESGANEKLFIVDIGGGTFDTSILQVSAGKFQTLALDGDNRLGGDDFDNHIIEAVFKHIRKDHGTDLSSLKKSGLPQDEYRKARQTILKYAEETKIALSDAENSEIEIPNLFGGYSLSMNLTRAEFEKIAKNTLRKIENTIENTLSNGGFSINDIDKVVLVGGSSRIPAVQKFVTNFFGKQPFSDKPLDKLVAMGASLTANSGDSIQIIDIISHSLGIEMVNDEFSAILKKNQQYPISFTKRYTTVSNYQPEIQIEIFEGEDSDVNMNDYYGGFSLSNIEKAPAGVPQIDVTFEFDENRILHVTAQDVRTGSSRKEAVDIEKGAVKRVKKTYEKSFDIVLTVDISGSMCGTPIQQAKNACQLLVSDMIDLNTHNVGVVEFGSSASVVSNLSNSQSDLQYRISNIECRGSTNMASGIEQARQVLSGARNEKLAIIVTDGYPDWQDSAMSEGNYMKSDTTLITIGIGDGVDEIFLRNLATSSAHYYSGSDFSQLSSIFQKITSSLQSF
ncbi:molecular chaperone [Thiovulum sp. ES]|nr:molecular chaperone [Thiovulum sp. ES]